MDAAAFCARWDRRAVSEESVSDQQRADERRLLRTAKSCGPDAPTLASSSRSCVGPTGFRQNLALRMTVAKEPGHRGEHDISRKTIACGNAGRFRCTRCCSCAFYQYKVHTRLRVQRAPGIPHALLGGGDLMHDSGAPRREIANACLRGPSQSRLRHSGAMRSIEPGISRFPDAQCASEVWSCGPSRNDGVLLRMRHNRMRPRQKKSKSRARPPRAMVAYSIARNNPPATYILRFIVAASVPLRSTACSMAAAT